MDNILKEIKTPTVIAITGGSGSGKSVVSDFFQELGASVCDADKLAKEIRALPETLEKLKAAFGTEIINEEGKLKTQALADVVFSSSEQKEKLELIVTKPVVEAVISQVKGFREKGTNGLLILDCPLLFELNMDHLADENWCVVAPLEAKIDRLTNRDGITRMQAEKRISCQLSDEEKVARSHRILENSGTKEQLKDLVIKSLLDMLGEKGNVKLQER